MFGIRKQVVLPLNLEIKISPDDPVFKLTEICDELDYTEVYRIYLRRWRKIDPATLFEVVVFAYMNGIYSSRDIKASLSQRHSFYVDIAGCACARFQNERLAIVMENLFYQLIEKLSALGEKQIDQELPEIAFKYGLNPNVDLEQAIHFLSGIAGMSGISFVSDKGKRKTETQFFLLCFAFNI